MSVITTAVDFEPWVVDPDRYKDLPFIPAETSDAPEDPSTPYFVRSGDSFAGGIDFLGDEDLIGLRVEEGRTYSLYLGGADSGKGTLLDPILFVSNNNGSATCRNRRWRSLFV